MKKAKLLVVFILVTALVLTGCSAIFKGIGDNIVSGIQSELGVSVGSDGGVTISTSSGNMQIGGSLNWPKTWPSELPKLDGKVTAVTDTGLSSNNTGIMVFVTAASVDAVKSYAAKFANLGYDKVIETTSEGYYALYSNSKYYITITSDSDGEAVVAVTPNSNGGSDEE